MNEQACNILYLPVILIISFGLGFLFISIPGIRNRLKKKDIFFSEKEMEELTNYRDRVFASANDEYSRKQTPLN